MARWMCSIVLKSRMTSEELRHRLNIKSVSDVVRRSRLRWFRRIKRKHDGDWVHNYQKLKVKGGKVGKGRSRKTWLKSVKGDIMKELRLKGR